MYKIEFQTLGFSHGTVGNVYQGAGVCYTESSLDIVESELNEFLLKSKRKAVIQSVKKIEGFILGIKKEGE